MKIQLNLRPIVVNECQLRHQVFDRSANVRMEHQVIVDHVLHVLLVIRTARSGRDV